jgi:hypothetical protein
MDLEWGSQKESFLKGTNKKIVAADAGSLQKLLFNNYSGSTWNGASTQLRKAVHFWTI